MILRLLQALSPEYKWGNRRTAYPNRMPNPSDEHCSVNTIKETACSLTDLPFTTSTVSTRWEQNTMHINYLPNYRPFVSYLEMVCPHSRAADKCTRDVGIQGHSTQVLCGGEWWASLPSLFTFAERDSGTFRTGGWLKKRPRYLPDRRLTEEETAVPFGYEADWRRDRGTFRTGGWLKKRPRYLSDRRLTEEESAVPFGQEVDWNAEMVLVSYPKITPLTSWLIN
jgi:hypothetical protein